MITMRLRRRYRRSGLSLLEVLTALAIFFLSVVAIGQMVDTASQTAVRAQRLTKAAIICESRMSEIVSGILPLQSIDHVPVEEGDPGWFYSVLVEPEDWTSVSVDGESVTGLNTVHVTVAFTGMRVSGDVEYSLSRIVLDPRLRKNAPEPVIEGTAPTSGSGAGAAGSSGGTGSGGGGNTSGGGGGGGGGGGNPTGGGGGNPSGGGGGGRTNTGGAGGGGRTSGAGSIR